ncbi:MAG: nucleotidyltransferase domain-containing protein [Burkholderiales bacterium]|nr:nucleotidyltransferase domain-containing protein [Phycisphaerae bacterium]
MLDLIEQHRAALEALCAKYGVRRLELFGSAVGGGFDRKNSDLDLVVHFHNWTHHKASDRFFGLLFDLESLFGRKVDLVTDGSIRNPYFRRNVDASKVAIYAA